MTNSIQYLRIVLSQLMQLQLAVFTRSVVAYFVFLCRTAQMSYRPRLYTLYFNLLTADSLPLQLLTWLTTILWSLSSLICAQKLI